MPATFLSLPLELRQLIYEQLFSTYVVRHGFRRASSEHRAALLQTCKQIHLEAWTFLPQHVSFHFYGTEAMLETFLDMEQAILTRIRHIRVKSFPFPLYADVRRDFYSIYFFSNALSLLPGLHLEQLVVEDSFHGPPWMNETWRDVVTYFDIEALLKSDGWKELVYITPNTDFIASGYDHKRQRVAQPENWNAMLRDRDGETSGAEMQMFITPEGKKPDDENGTMQPWSAVPGHELFQDPGLAGPDQNLKGEVRIVARRGKRARYIQTGLSEKRTWEELKEDLRRGYKMESEYSVPIRVSPRANKATDWTPYHNNMADGASWMYSGFGRRMHLAHLALNI